MKRFNIYYDLPDFIERPHTTILAESSEEALDKFCSIDDYATGIDVRDSF